MIKTKRIIWLCFILLAMLTIKSLAATGDIVEFDGMTITIPEVQEGINDLEDPRSPINSMKFSASDTTQDEKKEEIKTIISKFGNDKNIIGIDVSQHNGTIDWKKVAESGVKFAMIRVGGRGWGTEGNLYYDTNFDTNVKGALQNGIYVGVYFYSAAVTSEEALKEAAITVEKIQGYDIQFPVAYDFEEFYSSTHRTAELTKEQLEENTKVFLNYISKKGYKVALYSSASYLKTKWDMSKFSDYGTWVANWYVSKPDYSSHYDIWQYSDAGVVPGINGYVDVNIDYTYWLEMQEYISKDDKKDDKKEETKEKEIDWNSNPPHVYTSVHVQDYGWKDYVKDGSIAGTTGEAKRLESMRIKIYCGPVTGGIQYRSHIQDIGWENGWKSNDILSGTTGMSKRMEAVQIKLTGDIANYYDIYYRSHVQDFGWLGWAKNGESSGSEGFAKRVEAIEIKLVLKTGSAPKSEGYKFVSKPDIKYKSHVQDYGWMDYVMSGISGTTGESKRVEAMNIELLNNKIGGGIEYKSHIQDYGWENAFAKDNAMTGTSGESKRLEAIQIRLYGEVANVCDIYYRVHVQDFGWLGWAKNGEISGTTGLSKRIEAIEIYLVPKNDNAPGDTSNAHIS